MPQIRRLASAIVLEVVLSKPRLTSARPAVDCTSRACPAGFAALSGPDADPGLCYRRLGTPVTITYAAISLIRQPASYGLDVALRAGDRAARGAHDLAHC